MARKKKSKGLRVSLMLTVGLMIVSFAAGMLTQKIVFREPQTDAGLGGLDEAAGVDNANVCFGHILGDLPACVPQPGQHVLAVHEVFRAAERNKS